MALGLWEWEWWSNPPPLRQGWPSPGIVPWTAISWILIVPWAVILWISIAPWAVIVWISSVMRKVSEAIILWAVKRVTIHVWAVTATVTMMRTIVLWVVLRTKRPTILSVKMMTAIVMTIFMMMMAAIVMTTMAIVMTIVTGAEERMIAMIRLREEGWLFVWWSWGRCSCIKC